jgi:hypothetical protein
MPSLTITGFATETTSGRAGMSAIGDIASILEKIPIWKRLTALPAEFEALKARIAALEEEVQKRPSLEQCAICNTGNSKVTGVRPHPQLGPVGVQERTLQCDNPACKHSEKRLYDPNKK